MAPNTAPGDYEIEYTICEVLNPTNCDTQTETVVVHASPEISLIKNVGMVEDTNSNGIQGDSGDRIYYEFQIVNVGDTSVANVTVNDRKLGVFNAPVIPSALRPGESATLTGLYYTITDTDTLAGQISNVAEADGLPVASDAQGNPIVSDVLIDANTGQLYALGDILDQSDSGTRPDLDSSGNPIPIANPSAEGGESDATILNIHIPEPDLSITKVVTAGPTQVQLGDVVPYTITLSNAELVVASGIDVVDVLPIGMIYVPGTAQVDDVDVDPIVTGRTLTFSGLSVPPVGDVVITLTARVGPNSAIGKLVNQATAIDPATGAAMTNTASAIVERTPEHVFDCSDVIGKVFDDYNHDGSQNQGEPGLAGVRIVTVGGVLITTDEFGRYHVPCAALPDKHGSNFILKLDERSLPSGYRMTTENPRVMRLTPGKFAKMNFGAAISNVIRIDL
ncbi:DUF7507 domain-containing protein, partial [Paramylibacter kogurei]|uniref:DUF7507 domain-containing protein n=1 Tax=Paramylibacter kogurei TaxID=1889778 RepID=UPI003B837601